MLVFDEKKYAKSILKEKDFKTYRQKDIERYILIRYLASEGMSFSEIRDELNNFPIVGCEYLDKKDVDLIYEKIMNKALSCPLVTGIEIDIYKEELDVIKNLDDEDLKGLLFVLLVYYKWAITQPYLFFFSRNYGVKMAVVKDYDIWKYAGIMKLRIADRYKLCNKLIKDGLYVEDNFKNNNYFYLPFCKNEGEIAIKMSNYDNILGELYYFFDKKGYKRCQNCGVVIKKTRSPKKYCASCKRIVSNRQKLEYKRKKRGGEKTQTFERL